MFLRVSTILTSCKHRPPRARPASHPFALSRTRARQPLWALPVAKTLLVAVLPLAPSAMRPPFELPAQVVETVPVAVERDSPWSFTALLGRHNGEDFRHILQLDRSRPLDSHMAGFAVARRVYTMWEHLDWEVEGSAYQHWGIEDHQEFNLAFVARWTALPWDEILDTSLAFGQGVSWATELPDLEDDTRRLLHHLIAEVEFAPPQRSAVSLVLRLHHRSGVFGLYGASGGSNALMLGLRYRF